MADTLIVGAPIIIGGATYTITEVGTPQNPENNQQAARLGQKFVRLIVKVPGSGPVPSDYKNTAIGNDPVFSATNPKPPHSGY